MIIIIIQNNTIRIISNVPSGPTYAAEMYITRIQEKYYGPLPDRKCTIRIIMDKSTRVIINYTMNFA